MFSTGIMFTCSFTHLVESSGVSEDASFSDVSRESLSKRAIEDPQGSLSRSDMCQGHGVYVHYLNAEDLAEDESEQAHEKRLGQDVLRMARAMMKRVDEKRIRRQGAA
jgi:hypothetical protein